MSLKIKKQIHDLVQKYAQNRDYYRSAQFNETMLRSEFLDPLFELLGWDIKNTKGMSTNEREVLLEEPLKGTALSNVKKPDYTFRLYGERKFFLEAKKPSVSINLEDEPAKQVRRYGYSAKLKISVLSNFEDLYIYDTSYPVEKNDTRTRALIVGYHYTQFEESIEELLHSIGKESVYSGSFDEVWHNIDINISKQSVDDLFLRQINEWRLMLGNQILNLTSELDLTRLGDIVQSYINKILFLRVCEDRDIETYQRLLQIANHGNGKELIDKFREADKKYNSGLFKECLSDDVVCNVSSVFWDIIRQLYYPESPYSFSVLSSEILGKIYEIFIGQRLVIVDGELTIVNKPENEERDIVTTPTYVVREIIRQTIGDSMRMKDVDSLCQLKFADISCGSGVFLLELYQQLQDALIDYYIGHDNSRLIRTSINTYKLPFETKKKLLTSCIFGVDKDFNAVEACKFGLLLKMLEGENSFALTSFHPILPSLERNIFFGNSLFSLSDVDENQQEEINPFDFGQLRFDYIIGNPPYMKTEDIKNITPAEHRLYPRLFSSAYKQYDKYFLFIERALKLLKSDGCMGYIVPSKFMKVGAAEKLRKHITDRKYLKSITSFGAYQVFPDKSNYTCIIVLKKCCNATFFYSEIEDLDAWRHRSDGSHLDCERDASSIGKGTWVLYTDKYKSLLEGKIINCSIPLGCIVGDDYIFNGIQTSANKVYVLTPLREDRRYYYFEAFDSHEYIIEKSVTKPFFRTIGRAESLNSYRTFEPNARVIFPYKRRKNGNLTLMSISEIHKIYPCLYSYLMAMKDVLDDPSRDIKPKPKTANEWYRYGRQQSLDACEVNEKIVVGVLSQADKYAIDSKGTLVASGGTAGYCMICIPPDRKYSIYYIQAILGSVQGEWLASLYGEIFRGGYIARGTKVLKQIPIRTIDFDNDIEVAMHDDIVNRQKRLIAIGDKLTQASGAKRSSALFQRQFDTLKMEQQDAINALYGMSRQEQNLIPIIKEIYAKD